MSAFRRIWSASHPGADLPAGVAEGPFLTRRRHSALLTNVVADDATGEAGQDRRQGGPARSIRHFSACRDRDSTAVVSGHPATDRRPPAEAGPAMTPDHAAVAVVDRRARCARRWSRYGLAIRHWPRTWSPTSKSTRSDSWNASQRANPTPALWSTSVSATFLANRMGSSGKCRGM